MILAGGRGERMAAGRNKALLELTGQPLLLHSVETFRACCDRLLVVSAAEDIPGVRKLLPAGVPIVAGGATRHGSELSALTSLRPGLAGTDVIAVHDAARPLVSPADVLAVLAAAREDGAAMLAAASALPALEVSGERVTRGYSASELWRAQTPQASCASWLLDAYQRAAAESFDGTDTAAVLSRAGYPLRIVPATSENPKITVPADLELAEALLRRASERV